MQKILCLLLFINSFLLSFFCFSQTEKINEFALSPTIVWNKTKIFNVYSGARASYKTGTAFSSGINLNYSRSIYKTFFAKAGIGYFKQKFGIHRGFDFEETNTVTGLFYTTEYYAYHCFNYFGGIGYSKFLKNNYRFNLFGAFHFFDSYRQQFKHNGNFSGGNINPQNRKEDYSFGNSFVLTGGINKTFKQKFSLGIDILLPVYTKWRKDKIFRENMDEFYSSGFSLGTSINFIYHLNQKK